MRERAGGMSVDVQSEVRRQNNSFGTHRSSHGTGTGISGLEMGKDDSPSVLRESASLLHPAHNSQAKPLEQ